MNEHWTSDPDLVEDYVRGMIGEERRKALEAHLDACPACREHVEREHFLKEGIRSYGRALLKERLKGMIDQRKPGAIPWPHVVSIAAALVIIVGLGIMHQWRGEDELIVREEDVAAKIPSQDEKVLGPPGDRPAEHMREETAVSPTTASPGKRDVAGARASAPTSRPTPERHEFADEAEEVRWIAGVVVNVPVPQPENADAALMQKADGVAREEGFRRKTFRPEENGENIRILQRPERELPQNQQSQVNNAGIPTMLRRTGSLVELILFSDTLSLEGQAIRVERISADSLVVIIDQSAVAFKIPAQTPSR